jgi:hypothetical protein
MSAVVNICMRPCLEEFPPLCANGIFSIHIQLPCTSRVVLAHAFFKKPPQEFGGSGSVVSCLCLQIKMEGLTSHKKCVLFISSQHVSAQIVALFTYIFFNLNLKSKLYLVLCRIRPNCN